MNISIKGTHIDVSSSLKEYVEEKIGNLGKFIIAQEAKVELERDQHHHSGLVFRAEVNMFMGSKVVRAEARAEEAYAAIDLLIPKLKEQIGKFKDKRVTLQRRRARSARKKL